MKTITESELTKKLGAFVAVENLPSRNGRGSAPNQFRIRFENGEVFQSYKALVGAKIGGQLYLSDYYHDYSNTTSSHCGWWCGKRCQERRAGIKDESIIVIE